MILADLDGAAIAGRDAIVARVRLIDVEWTNVVYDDPRGITSTVDVLALARATGAAFVCIVLVADIDTTLGTELGHAIRTIQYTLVLAQIYGEGEGTDEFIGRAEKMENRVTSADYEVTVGGNTFDLAVTGAESAEPFAVVLDEAGGEVLGMTKALTINLEVTVCV